MSNKAPSAWMLVDKETNAIIATAYKPGKINLNRWEIYPLYTSPPTQEPLSEEVVGELLMDGFSTHLMDLVRMIEKAHGIGADE